jgi:hypothetical protein
MRLSWRGKDPREAGQKDEGLKVRKRSQAAAAAAALPRELSPVSTAE